MSDEVLYGMAERLGALLERTGECLVTAESCTAGGLAEIVTRVPGSSRWFERGFVTYSDAAKQDLLEVAVDTLARYGAASEETAAAMARGALANSRASVAVAITGIAGPEGGSPEKPVGTVCLAWLRGSGEPVVTRTVFTGGRLEVRRQACLLALQGLIEMLEKQ